MYFRVYRRVLVDRRIADCESSPETVLDERLLCVLPTPDDLVERMDDSCKGDPVPMEREEDRCVLRTMLLRDRVPDVLFRHLLRGKNIPPSLACHPTSSNHR